MGRSGRGIRGELPWALALVALSAGCDQPPADPVACPADRRATLGLLLRARLTAPNGGTGQSAGHVNAILAVGDDLYAANAQDAVAAFALVADGSLRSTAPLATGVDPRRPPFCTALAAHGPSSTLYCGYAYGDTLTAFHLTPGAAPTLRAMRALDNPRLSVRGMTVAGDLLYLALFRNGLWTARIAADGSLSDLQDTGLGGDPRFVSVEGDRVVVLDATRGLVLARAAGRSVTALGSVSLDGPPLDLSVRGGVAIAALGSSGAAIVDVSGAAPSLRLSLRPSCVVTSGDLEADSAAVVCTSGTLLYDLSGPAPRVAGFSAAHGIMLQGRFHRGELLVTDWLDLVRFRADPRGQAAALDTAWGTYERADGASSVVVRNMTDLPTRVMAIGTSDALGSGTVAAQGTWRAAVPGGQFTDDDGVLTTVARISTLDPSGCSFAAFEPRLLRRSEPVGPGVPPAVGDAMPALTLAVPGGGGVITLPEPGRATRYVFWSHDCAAMWPELEDLDYLARVGRSPDGAEPVFISAEDPARARLRDRWPVPNLRLAYYGSMFDDVPREVEAVVARYGGDLYERGFVNSKMLAGARHPTDYTVDAQGTVRAVERLYRGAFPLR
jgi:hypothetical protein